MEDNEIRNRIRNAEANKEYLELNETIVAQAPLRDSKSISSYRTARWSLAGAAAMALAIGLALPQALTPQPLFEIAGGSAQSTNLRMGSPEAADSKVSGELSMIWPGWIEYNYLADGISDQGGRGEIFQVRRVGDPQQLLEKLASTFGISGEPKEDEWSTDEYPSYSIAGEGFSLSVWWSGPGGWNYSRWTDNWVGCVEPGVVEGDDQSRSAEAPVCDDSFFQPTPELVPSEPEMLRQAEEIFQQLGIDFDPALARVWRDDWGGSVSMPMTIAGQPIPLESYIGWDGKGNLSYASGYSVEIVSRGDFDTISPLAAIERISDWRWFGGAASKYYEDLYANYPAVARSEPAISEPVEDAPVDEVSPDEPAVLPAPEEQPTEPQIVDVTINRSEQVLPSAYDAQGNMWLVPGYLLYNDQGWFDAIIAVEEGVISLPEPVDVTPLYEEPATTGEN